MEVRDYLRAMLVKYDMYDPDAPVLKNNTAPSTGKPGGLFAVHRGASGTV